MANVATTNKTSENLAKVVEAEYRQMYECDNVAVKIPLMGKYVRFDKAHKISINGKTIFIPGHYVHGFLFPGTKLIMYRHFYISQELLGKTINAKVILSKKIYENGRVQFILDIKPQSSSQSKYDLKIITEKPAKNKDLGPLICLKGKAIGKIACREIVK